MPSLLKIQPLDQPGQAAMTPFYVHMDGSVGQQHLWNGYPARLVGFQRRFDTLDIEVPTVQAFFEPGIVVGVYPVFVDRDEKASSYLAVIGAIEFVESEPEQIPDA